MKFSFLVFIWTFLFITNLNAAVLNIYCEDDRPLQFMGADGNLTGMTVEVTREIQKRIGNFDSIRMIPWPRGLSELNTKPNTILFSVTRTAEREELYQWIGPVSEAIFSFYARADSKLKISSLEDAKKVRIVGVYRDDIRDQYLTKAGFTNLNRTTDSISNFKLLIAGRIDLYASDATEIQGHTMNSKLHANDVKVAFSFLSGQLYLAASKGTDPTIVAKWNQALESMKRDGSYALIFRRYFPDAPLPGPALTTSGTRGTSSN